MRKSITRVATRALMLLAIATSAIAKDNKPTFGIPYDLISKPGDSTISIQAKGIEINASKGTDLYTSPDASVAIDNTPRIAFTPKADFIFSAKVNAQFNAAFDGGALYVYADGKNWAKFLFERFQSGKNGVASTVNRHSGDDAYHQTTAQNAMFLKVVRKAQTILFYLSEDGDNWHYTRSFKLATSAPIEVGLMAQAPLSNAFNAVFTDIQFSEKTMTDFWQGK
ncbi:DUF1349 domain-containing protein [Catenovulum sp. SM1970]|uniref:DUF1349 domain-containing protein n=1 Tax=Marinifaba aquimaris TaxID=2741323 RepID=UPI0015744F94|nr:DUF1349 domain-containing protein [Marinifaba aquimaris]NTS76323.1 DUF1349 domain-containing protein [Marinifaba aquimaris]